ncbi:thioesterase II family protein [Saccharopolyspora erythraea]|uniref:Thioesterase involved in non-ribosomal peptide biosynthesis n=2 Tax=Saccharopolyspora erythraea TaxID=1836 RepID=A4FHL9_SACEN|nr:alpha/beta fold hydrolase [Saccharopolyspora erythraea]EQD81828.1 oleoyl-ACP hydrolase [Saccharopolyspora erythraea D]QRK87428.1 thioesterase [Saccharopolyspora erythraea]CAM03544.1 thioesterase involved in non-ribosomal peptide biosynthesis [Saccharopolyspora erythraea NRRL 2338]
MQPIRLFCFPHAGGGMAAFRPWVGALGPEIEVVPVPLPGREARIGEPAHTRMEALAEQVTRELAPSLDRPHACFGHSMGAGLAWEVARRTGPLGVVASARRGPHLPTRRRRLSELPDELFLAELGRLGGTPREVLDNPELVELLLPTLRADFTLSESFTAPAGRRLHCPVVAMAGEDDHEVDRDELAAWERSTTGAFRSHRFPGGHFYLAEANPEVLSVVRAEVLRFAEQSALSG